MKRLYTLSFAKTENDGKNTGSMFIDQFSQISDEEEWIHTHQDTLTSLTRDEQIAHIDTLLSILLIPGEQESDVGMNFDKVKPVALTDRIAVGVTENVKEIHTLNLSPSNVILEASMTDPDERRFVQKDFIAIIERLYKDIRKYETSQDIYSIQKAKTTKPKAIKKEKVKV
jgi:hypothetical protein